MLKKKYYDGTQIHRIISEEVKDYDTIMKILKRFADEPSALGTDLAEVGTDCISRQEAIDAIHRIQTIISYNKKKIIFRSEAADVIKSLSSAQLEIVRCEDCKWWTKQEASLQGRCALLGIYPTGRWYCANAKKKGDPNE